VRRVFKVFKKELWKLSFEEAKMDQITQVKNQYRKEKWTRLGGADKKGE